jgi:hypothetical protein
MDRREERATGADTPWSADAGPEPEWAEAIRRGRKARGDRLREVFAAFDDDAEPSRRPRRPEGREGDAS